MVYLFPCRGARAGRPADAASRVRGQSVSEGQACRRPTRRVLAAVSIAHLPSSPGRAIGTAWSRGGGSTEAGGQHDADCASLDDPGLAYRRPISAVLSIAAHGPRRSLFRNMHWRRRRLQAGPGQGERCASAPHSRWPRRNPIRPGVAESGRQGLAAGGRRRGRRRRWQVVWVVWAPWVGGNGW